MAHTFGTDKEDIDTDYKVYLKKIHTPLVFAQQEYAKQDFIRAIGWAKTVVT